MPTSPPTDLLALLDACAARGIALAAGPTGGLKVRAPTGALTPELQTKLRLHKAALVALLAQPGNDPADQAPIPPRPAGAPAPLSSAQARLWFLNQLDPRSVPAYNIVAAVRIRGPLQPAALQAAVQALAARHETLRTGFVNHAGQPEQRIAAAVEVPFTIVDLTALTANEHEGAVAARLRAEAQHPFDLTTAPLLRTTLLQLADEEHAFLFTLHHLISDGWSSGVIVSDLASAYRQAAADQPVELPPLAVQFADYAAWQAQRLASPAAAADLAYWTERLAGTPVLDLPVDHPRPAAMSFAGATAYETFPPELATGLQDLARQEDATLFQALLAGFKAVLWHYTGQTDLAVGTSIANRNHPDLEPLIGFLTNTLVLRTQLDGDATFGELIQRVRATATDAYAHAETPLERIIETLQPERSMSQNPLFQVCFSLLQAHRDALQLGDGLELEQLNVDSATARFDLTVTVENTRAGLLVAVEYSRDLFEPETITRFLAHYRTLLDAAVAAPATLLRALPLLAAADRQRLLYDWNQSATAYPREACIHDLFAESVRGAPDRIAVLAGERQLTYGELNAHANRLAHRLRAAGVGADTPVAVCAERSVEMIVALVAVLKAGGHYMPFDPEDPSARLQRLFDLARPRLVLAPVTAVARLPETSIPVQAVDLADPAFLSEPTDDLPSVTRPENLAYTTFTSGSTGVPKGICVPHRGVVRLVRETNYLDYGPDLRILELAPVSFDASTFEIWGALCNGAVLVIFRPGPPSIRELADTIEQQHITTLYLTSALFNLMVDERLPAFASVRHLLVGGDIISVPHTRRLLETHDQITLINGYGPTETTTFASCGMLCTPADLGHSVTIGPPMSNTTLYILNPDLEPVPVGIPGDLYIGGDGNARGYLDRPDLTAESFVPHPFPGTPGERLYRTGDLARWAPNGTAEFIGRRDFQVKVRGFRIELGEIESALSTHPDVEKALVLVIEDRPGDKRLVACLQTAPGQTAPTDAALRTHLQSRLPDFMVPSAFLAVDAFPLTAHGKVDRTSLREAATTAAAPTTAYAAPAGPVEEIVADVWANVLQADRIGRDDGFFDHGGHSLLATQVMWRIFEVFGVELPLRLLFEHPTTAAFAGAITHTVDTATNQPGRAEKVARIHLRVNALSPAEVERLLAAKRKTP
jgi:amino acid adenylation domain-containing protein